ncbi:16S rRNA (uracil(1498)-N(3))-methyltransferase [Blastomonas aquatica]|uniref:Ribosomal RNA small subunit methyltransferase E n=1 Tax=Blastomonas aquatica TaxID=1510276 RepID=A0ABQ1JN62_9SPHN|nr:16S rRNA (uracil(1498)-N(3))-methyltransferase [Blastomonas aquatica]GGB73293.1 ribosomal RNA small subunit methyltransferase E [Blastomonas aquatica]
MTATPAWPPRSAPRLFVDTPLTDGMSVRVEGNQAHYLINVMRLAEGAAVKLFDDVSGEYLAKVSARGKRDLTLTIESLLRPRDVVPDFWLCAAPIKKARFDFLGEKACELGVARFVPVLTDRAVVDKVKDDRLRGTMIEAAEQCERTALPQIAALTKLDALLKTWPEGRHLFFADERLHESSGATLAQALVRHTGPAAVLIGPEGGFTDSENAAIRAHPAAVPVSLGPRILRAETAAIAATAVWMAAQGDWAA